MRKSFVIALSMLLLVAAAPKKKVTPTDWNAVGQALGREGSLQPGDVYKASFPRGDLSVTVDGVTLKPALALGSWAAFKDVGGEALAMGDLVLLESEVNPVIDALQRGGIEPTAMHNHLLGESPHVFYMHFHGHGEPVKLAQTLHEALGLTKTPMAPPAPPPAAQTIDLPTSDLDRVLGRSGNIAGGTYQFAFPRVERITEHGLEIPPSMGVAMPVNFQPVGNGRAVITGDLVMIASEVNPVIRALRAGGVTVTALHSHMLDESPRLFFMHFWGNGEAIELARAMRSALDRIHVKR